MSWQVQIIRAKPNPAGKDRNQSYPIKQQLLGEWVDLKNVGDQAVSLTTLNLAHTEFDDRCSIKTESQIYWKGSAVYLNPGQTVRVHTGRSADTAHMAAEDRAGVDLHAYAERDNFALNNRCGDNLSVWWKNSSDQWQNEDKASYDPNPPDGAVLVRRGNKLVP